MKELESLIGYSFHDPSLLEAALCHSSYANEHREMTDNERLEFLGDAVLELCSTHYLYDRFPGEAEGPLSRQRAAIVCESSLAACARKLSLGRYLLLGKGEEKIGGRERDSLLSDAFEAVIGAVYLDGGLEEARRFVVKQVMEEMTENPVYYDAKTRLQEWLQENGDISIVYRLTEEEGPEHEKLFTAEVSAGGRLLGRGKGHSKKQAEQAAALEALTLRDKPEG